MRTVSQQAKEMTVTQQDKVGACDHARGWCVLTASAHGWVAVVATSRDGAPLISYNGGEAVSARRFTHRYRNSPRMSYQGNNTREEAQGL